MIDAFWGWLSRADARFSLGISLALVLAAVLYVMRQLPVEEIRDEGEVKYEAPVTEVGQGRLVHRVSARNDSFAYPFVSTYLQDYVDTLEQDKPTGSPSKPPPDILRQSMALMYRGMMTLPDGQIVALIENNSGGETASYLSGATLGAFTIERFSAGVLELSHGGATNSLVAGYMQTLEY